MLIGAVPEELIYQVSVSSVNFDGVESQLFGVHGGFSKGSVGVSDVFFAHDVASRRLRGFESHCSASSRLSHWQLIQRAKSAAPSCRQTDERHQLHLSNLLGSLRRGKEGCLVHCVHRDDQSQWGYGQNQFNFILGASTVIGCDVIIRHAPLVQMSGSSEP